MRDRADIARDIVLLNGNLNILHKELSLYPWDIENPIIDIANPDVLNILNRVIAEQISYAELEDWANLIEGRDDFSFESEKLQEIIFRLANPSLHGGMNQQIAIKLVKELQNR